MTNTAGYSKKSLAEKLGIKPNMTIAVLNPPEHYLSQTLLGLPESIRIADQLEGQFDLIQHFAVDSKALTTDFEQLRNHLKLNGSLWISWVKLTAGGTVDLSEAVVRQIGLDGGLVDVKLIAVDATWSALKFVYRLKDR